MQKKGLNIFILFNIVVPNDTYSSVQRYESYYSPSSYGQIVGQTELFNLVVATGLGEAKVLIKTC